MGSKKPLEIVKTFYETYGWKRDGETGQYMGEVLHEDIDRASQDYMANSEMRYSKYFGDGGRFFLDAGCGAKPRQKMAESFQIHVCVDLSLLGLKEAKEQLGDRGRYVMADLAMLPFKEEAFAGVLASHSLYHIDKDQQPIVVRELYRATETDKNLLIFYSANRNLVSLFEGITSRVIKKMGLFLGHFGRNRNRYGPYIKTAPSLYIYRHNPVSLTKGFKSVKVTCLRTLTGTDMQVLKKLHLFRLVVPALSFLERTFPYLMIHIGKYVAISIRRSPGSLALDSVNSR